MTVAAAPPFSRVVTLEKTGAGGSRALCEVKAVELGGNRSTDIGFLGEHKRGRQQSGCAGKCTDEASFHFGGVELQLVTHVLVGAAPVDLAVATGAIPQCRSGNRCAQGICTGQAVTVIGDAVTLQTEHGLTHRQHTANR